MPKEKKSVASRLQGFVSEFGSDIFSTDNKVLICKVCETKVSSEKRFSISQHIASDKHVRGVQRFKRKEGNKKIQLLVPSISKKSEYNLDLCKAMLAANIPLNKLSNPQFRSFLEKYTMKDTPVESTLRLGYVDKCYIDTVNEIKEKVNGKKIWISMDETTDVEGRYIVSTIIGTLLHDSPGEIFLLNIDQLEKANHSTICKALDKSLLLLWPDGIQYDNVLLFVTDAAPYMTKAARTLQSFYTKMIHLTCMAHGLHRVAEEIRSQFGNVDDLVANVKQVFRKCPYRIQFFRNEAPDLPVPPSPVITRWGTWLTAASYYCTHFETIKRIVESFDESDAVAIKKSKNVFKLQQLQANLIYIKSNFDCLPIAITRLQEQSILLSEGLKIVEEIQDTFTKLEGHHGIEIKKKLKYVLDKNIGYNVIRKISKVLSGEEDNIANLDLPDDMTANDLLYFKYAPLTSADVERSFSMLKNLLVDNRRSFKLENIKKTLIIQCNFLSKYNFCKYYANISPNEIPNIKFQMFSL